MNLRAILAPNSPTSLAVLADWIFLLVRTDDTTKHNGITFVLADIKSPGVEVKPIRLISEVLD